MLIFSCNHVTTIAAYVRDSIDMISSLKSKGSIEGDVIMAIFDVESQYTCIPHHGGLEAITFLNQLSPEALPSTPCIKELAELVLTKNIFMFQNDFFLQTRGTAMGCTIALNYANLFMGLFEQDIIFCQNNQFLSRIKLWHRYVDIIMMVTVLAQICTENLTETHYRGETVSTL
ncbi:unnamed protein product [Coregonus sp. 'balchen']|nr:unnamed protein product [Coregonus sp. 'balchen']